MQDFCDKLVELIGEAPDPQTSTELSRILSRCKESADAARSSTTSDDSGGGGAGDPPRPPKPPKPITE